MTRGARRALAGGARCSLTSGVRVAESQTSPAGYGALYRRQASEPNTLRRAESALRAESPPGAHMATVSELFVRAFDDAADAYHETVGPLIDAVADLVVARAELSRGAVLVDLGTGPGTVLLAALRAGFKRLDATGVDLSERQIQIGRKRLSDAGSRARLVHMDAAALDLGDNTADAVTSSLTLPYLDDPLRSIREAARVAQPGAPVVVSTFGHPLLAGFGDRLLRAMDGAEIPSLPLALARTPEELAQWAFRSGLDDVVIEEHDIGVRYEDVDAFLQTATVLGLQVRLSGAPDELVAAVREAVAQDERVVGPTGEIAGMVRVLLLRGRAT